MKNKPLFASILLVTLVGCNITPNSNSVTPIAANIKNNDNGYDFDGTFGGHGYGFGSFANWGQPAKLSQRNIIRGLLAEYSDNHINDKGMYSQYGTLSQYGWHGNYWHPSPIDIVATTPDATCYHLTYTLSTNFQAEGELAVVPAGQPHDLYGFYSNLDYAYSFSASL